MKFYYSTWKVCTFTPEYTHLSRDLDTISDQNFFLIFMYVIVYLCILNVHQNMNVRSHVTSEIEQKEDVVKFTKLEIILFTNNVNQRN